tara:strand:+ start:11417 stop:14056 length:2640 start_codon:yes stop_codon:yes gene_type:complete
MQSAETVWALMFAAAYTVSCAPALAKGPANQKYDIAAQKLPMALQSFSRISGRQIIYPYDSFASLRSNRVAGRMSAEKALRTMVRGLPVVIKVIDDHIAALSFVAPRNEPVGENAVPTGARDYRASIFHSDSRRYPARTGPEIVVTGRRLSQAHEAVGQASVAGRSAITRTALLSAPSGISGLKMLEMLPGFNVQTDGPLGLYEFGNSVQTRAFNLDQIGFVVDGIPLGRTDAFGGSPVFRYVDNENLTVVEASPGAGAVDLPSYSSLGPIIVYRSIAPQQMTGLFVSQTLGGDALKRSFLRVSTGKIGPFQAYLSRTKLDSGLWRGAGTIDREHWEGQIVAALGASGWARFKFVANDFFDYDSPALAREDYDDLTPDLGGRTGRNRGFIGFIPDLPETVPGIPYSNEGYTYYYGNAVNARRDRLFGLTLHAALAPEAEAEATFYYEDKQGFGVSPISYDTALVYYLQQRDAGLGVTAPRGLQYGLSRMEGDRSGITMSANLRAGAHDISLGIWAEQDRYRRLQLRLNNAGGSPAGSPLMNEVVYYRRDYRSQRDTVQLHARDRISMANGRLVLDLGVKALSLGYQQRGYGDYHSYALDDGSPGFGARYNRASYGDFFLPMGGALYKLDARSEFFASYAENMALPKGMDDIFAVPSPEPLPEPRPEKARNIEFGFRTVQPEYFASLTAYYTRFENRLQALTGILPGTAGVTETYYRNVGGVDAHGVELTGSYKPGWLGGAVYFNGNLAYNMARFTRDLPDGTEIAGNRIPDSAKWLALLGVTVEPASWLVANMTGKYTSRRYANYINTSSVPGFVMFSGYVDVGDGMKVPPFRNVRARVNVDNIFDRDVLSFIYSAVTDEGLFRPLAPRTVQITLSAEF